VSREELGIIAHTMMEVFPQVTLWRGIMAPGLETALLVGHKEAHPLELDVVARRMSESPKASLWEKRDAPSSTMFRELLVRYCGNLTASSSLWDRYPINTDDRPVIEYGYGGDEGRGGSWLVGERLLELLGELLMANPPDRDPYLRSLASEEHAVVRAGLTLQLARVLEKAGNGRDARTAMEMFSRLYAEGDRSAESETDQTRREIEELIDSYEKRLRSNVLCTGGWRRELVRRAI